MLILRVDLVHNTADTYETAEYVIRLSDEYIFFETRLIAGPAANVVGRMWSIWCSDES